MPEVGNSGPGLWHLKASDFFISQISMTSLWNILVPQDKLYNFKYILRRLIVFILDADTDFLLNDPGMTRRTERISRHTQDDADQLSRKSRGRDKQLLDGITQKLVSSRPSSELRSMFLVLS